MAEAAVTGTPAVTIKDLRVWGFFAAILLYAVCGTPTPERAGLAEILIGLALVAAAGPAALQAVSGGGGAAWQGAARALLAYGLCVPLITGLVLGNSAQWIFRDMIPFLFLLLPLFLYPLLAGRERDIRALTGIVVVLGVIFAARVVVPYLAQQAGVADPFRLANAPTVLFAALLLTGLCGMALYRGQLLRAAAFLALAVVPLAAMALITQRASIGIFGLTVLALLGIGIVRRPKRMVLPLLLLALAAAVYWPVIGDVLQELLQKHSAVGLNMRWQETVAVLDAVGGSAFAVLFGKGWGASVVSPAVGGAVVNFTHSLVTTYWLKTGLVGVGLALFYLWQMALMLLRMIFPLPVMALALAGPFVIDILLYASFKSLDFGLVLLLIALWHSCRAKTVGMAAP